MEAISSYKTFLMKKKSDSAWEKLVDIKEFPDLGGAREMLDTTTLSDSMKTGIPGIQDADSFSFTTNYDTTIFDTINALKDTKSTYAIWFGGTEASGTVTPSGDKGKFSFEGYVDVYVNGASVNEVVEMTITITPSSVITKEA